MLHIDGRNHPAVPAFLVLNANELVMAHVLAREPCLNTKDTTGTALALEAMANTDTHWCNHTPVAFSYRPGK